MFIPWIKNHDYFTKNASAALHATNYTQNENTLLLGNMAILSQKLV